LKELEAKGFQDMLEDLLGRVETERKALGTVERQGGQEMYAIPNQLQGVNLIAILYIYQFQCCMEGDNDL